jgi:fructose-1,6-bisphosphatase/sedoheptulose 1,7-bisphosphatase-like protein
MGATAAIAVMAVGAVQQYGATKAAGKAQQQLGDYNAAVDEMKAKDSEARGIQSEFENRLTTRKLIGSERVAFAASGVDIGDPDSTAVNVMKDTAKLSALDNLTIRMNAAREAWGYRAQAVSDKYGGDAAKAAADNKAIGGLLSTAGNVMYTKYGFKG